MSSTHAGTELLDVNGETAKLRVMGANRGRENVKKRAARRRKAERLTSAKKSGGSKTAK